MLQRGRERERARRGWSRRARQRVIASELSRNQLQGEAGTWLSLSFLVGAALRSFTR